MMYRSVFHIPKMDCPCEESLIRTKLRDIVSVRSLHCALDRRDLTVIHTGDVWEIENALKALNLGAQLTVTVENPVEGMIAEDPVKQKKALWIVLAINFAFFLIEISTGMLSRSMGLVADSLDMLADALVYGMGLMAAGAVIARKKRVALISGYIQILLALVGLSEVIRRFIGLEMMPDFHTMIGVSLLAFAANAACLWILQRTQSKEAHIKASIIFSANNVIVNIGVIVAGLLVWWFNSNVPDLVTGIIIFLIVIRGALRILKLAK